MCYELNREPLTNRRFKVLLVSNKDIFNLTSGNLKCVNISTIKFLNYPVDTRIIGYTFDIYTMIYKFLIEHETFPKLLEGMPAEHFFSKIIDHNRYIKLSKNL